MSLMSRDRILVAAGVAALLFATPAFADRCGPQNPAMCGSDAQSEPPNLALGGTGGCTEASIATLPMFKDTHMCPPGPTTVIYDLDQPFPNNGLPADGELVG